MRVHVVSDVHGAVEDLGAASDGADVFVCLGDLLLFVDYADPSRGILPELIGESHARAYIEARTDDRYDDARIVGAQAWDSVGLGSPSDRWAAIEERVRAQYSGLFSALPAPALLTYGNVDIPAMWPSFLRDGHTVIDGGTVEVGGLRWGFVGGGLVSPMRTPYELDPDVYAATVAGLGPVDILFTHIPPSVPELCYDVVARRFEVGSRALLEYVRDVQPRFHLFGHVHNPFAHRRRIGRTECLNVGHFNATRRPFVLDLPE